MPKLKHEHEVRMTGTQDRSETSKRMFINAGSFIY